MVSLTLGTKEYVVVDVKDRLGAIDTLTGIPITFTIKNNDRTVTLMSNVVAVVNGMRISCLVDTTGVQWEVAEYKLYITIPMAPENIILGPLEFEVNP